MLVLYSSKTGNTERFANKLSDDIKVINISEIDKIEESFILITYTTGVGEVPKEVSQFLSRYENHMHLAGVASSGNRNWGEIHKGGTFGMSANRISQSYDAPIVHKFELEGLEDDVVKFEKKARLIYHKRKEIERKRREN